MRVSGQRHAPAALPPGKGSPVPIGQEAGWAPEPVWTQRLEEKSFDPAGDRNPIARSSSPQSDTILSELTRLLYNIMETNIPGFRYYIFILGFNMRMISVGAREIIKGTSTFLEFPSRKTAGTVLMYDNRH
jgi:hypothetical protein